MPDERSAPEPLKLFLLGFLTLFLELVLIRYLAGSIWNLGFFPNLVLIAVFIGMGSGFVFHHHLGARLSATCFHLATVLLLVLVAFVTFLHPVVPGFDQWQGDFGGDLYFTAAPTHALWRNLLLFGFWFSAILAIFALIAQRTAKLFRAFAPLRAYTLDIAGSCCGIVCFMAMSWLQTPAWIWFAIVGLMFLLSQPARSGAVRALPPLTLAACSALAYYGDTRLLAGPAFPGEVLVRWSPYQKVEYVDSGAMSHRVFVNGVSHQHMDTIDKLRTSSSGIPYSQAYSARAAQPGLPPYRNVLVLGAGSGNDVAAALASGAEHVDAIEIDPVIAELGRRFHPARPYDDPRVTVTVTDGRAFLTQTRRRYDLIVFALTDSLVKVSPMAQLRLENYLFTEESLARAHRLLSEDGDLLFYNFYRQPWLRGKIEQMIRNVTGVYPKALFEERDFAMLAAGKHNSSPAPSVAVDAADIETARDDWPFLYLQKRGIPLVYVAAMSAVALLLTALMVVVQKTSPPGERSEGELATRLSFVFMGIAFLLLETKSIIQFSLLFGTTWINNSLVFLAVLLLVLAANWAATWLRPTALRSVYALLLASCLATLFYPLAGLLAVEDPFARFVLASLMTFSPIFFANLIFSIAFRDTAVPEHVFGWNLVGATLGGVIEYSSLALGYNNLAVVVALAYTASFVCLSFARRARDQGAREVARVSAGA